MTTTSFLNAQIVDDRVRLLYRDDEGVLKAKSLPAEYVSYHPKELAPDPDDSAALLRALRDDWRVLGSHDEGDYVRVRWRGKWERRDALKKLRDNAIEVLEGDVSPIKRLVSDHGLGIQKPRRLYFDIETDSRVNFVQSRLGEARVLSWAAIDEHGNEFTAVLREWTDEAEAELLEAFWALAETTTVDQIVEVTRDEQKKLLKRRDKAGYKFADSEYAVTNGYDQLIAYSGRHGDETYDFLVMEKRSRRVGAMPKDLSRWLWLDHHDVFERMNKNAAESGAEKQSLKLQDVAMELLGHGKDDFSSAKTYEAWAGGPEQQERLRRYNLKDVRLMLQIEEKTGYIEVFQALCEACGIFPSTYSLYPTVQMDGFMLRLGAERGVHFKTKWYDKEEDDHPKEQFEGAFVLHPTVRGIIKDVHVGDFASMYPSIIITLNMSPDTKLGIFPEDARPPGSCRAPRTGVCFSTSKQGILAFAINEMLRLRAYWRERQGELTPGTPEWVDAGRRSMAYKVAANSFFGAMGNRYARYYDEEIAESITTTGAWLAKHIIAEASDNWGIETLYGDTDATMARGVTRERFVEFVDHCNEKFVPKLIKDIGCVENRVKIDNEKGYKRLIFMQKSGKKELASKKYIGIYDYYKKTKADESSEPEIKGVAWRRGDANKMARDLQWDIIQHFRDNDHYVDKAAYVATVTRWKKKVLEDELGIDDVKVTAALGKELDEYVVKKKKDGDDASQPAHVRVGKVLRDRGKEAMLGTRIEYFMKDHPSRQVLPAEDFDGTFDRFWLWEDKVYKPSLTLLQAIFPDDPIWKELKRARPPKPKRGAMRDDVGGTGSNRGRDQLRGADEGTAGHNESLGRNAGTMQSSVARQDDEFDGRSGEDQSKKRRAVPANRLAHDSFVCGVCAEDVDVGDEFTPRLCCAECDAGMSAHVIPCARPGAICFACREKRDIPVRRKRKVVAVC